MIFCFVDESQGNPVFVLSSILVESNELFKLTSEINNFKNKKNIENLKELRREKFKNKTIKIELTKELVDILDRHKVLAMSIIIVHENDIDKKILYLEGIELLLERLTLQSDEDNKGVVLICDELEYRKETFKTIKDGICEKVKHGCAFKTKIRDHVYETPFFTEDEFSNGVQVADLVARAVSHAIREYSKRRSIKDPNKLENELKGDINSLRSYSPYLEEYWKVFRRGPNGQIKGYGIKVWGYWSDSKVY